MTDMARLFFSDPETLLAMGIHLQRPWLVRLALWRNANPSTYSFETQKDLEANLPTSSIFLELGRFSPLHHAAYKGNAAICELLLAQGVSPNTPNNMGITPLHVATLKNDTLCANTLLCAGAKPDQADHEGFTPLHHAAMAGNICESMFGCLMVAGSDPDRVDKNGYSPLYMAIHYRNEHAARSLLKAGASHSLRTCKSKNTALHLSATHDDMSGITQEIINRGARINAEDKDGVSPLMRAVQNRSGENARILLENSANPNTPDHARKTPLMAATSPKIVDLLLRHGANPNLEDTDGFTPLMHHCRQGHEQQALQLVQAGARINHAAKNGQTPLMLACQNMAHEIVDLLVENHADTEALDAEHKTAFDHLFTGVLEGIASSLRKKPILVVAPAPAPKAPF